MALRWGDFTNRPGPGRDAQGRDVRGAEVLFRGVLYEMRWSENGVLGCRFLCDSYGPPLFLRTTFVTLKGSRLADFRVLRAARSWKGKQNKTESRG